MAEKNKDHPKGVLKPSSGRRRQKAFQWDEMNILATYHPANKTYGHMKIDEPKTPYVFEDESGANTATGCSFSPEDLAARLCAAEASPDEQLPRAAKPVEEVEPGLSEEQRKFREKRRAHYNEFLAAKMAKERIQAEEMDDDDDAAAEEAARNAKYNATVGKADLLDTPSTNSAKKRSRSPQQRLRKP